MALNQAKIVKTAEKYLRQGKLDAAIAEYQKLVHENPKDLNTINRIGDLYARHSRTKEAIAQFTKIAEFYGNDGFLLKAIAIYKKINKLDPSHMEAYQRLAELYSQQGLLMEAKSQYQSVAEHYMKAGQLAKTREVYERVLKLAPDDLKTRLALAEVWGKEKKTAEAVKEYLAIGQDLDRRDMLKESVRIYETALRLEAGNREVLDRLIRALSQQGEHDQVIHLLEGQVKSRRDPGLMSLLAQAYLGKDRVKQAKELLEEAASIEPDSIDTRVALGRLQLKQGEVEAAYQSMLDASGRLEQEKKLTEASRLWEEFVRGQREHPEALAKLEDLYRRNEHPAKANATASDLADLLIKLGQTQEARQVLERLVASDAGNPQHRERLEALEQQPPAPSMGMGPAPMPEAEVDLPEIDLPTLEPQPVEAAGEGGAISLEELPEGEEQEDQEFVSERLTEAEVFVKYGLVDKALEQLRAVLQRYPRCIPARRKLCEFFQENGDLDGAVKECLYVAQILRDQGEGAQARQVLEKAVQIGGTAPLQQQVRRALGEEGAGAEAAPEPSVAMETEPPAAAASTEEVADLDLDLSLDEVPGAEASGADAPDLELELEAPSSTPALESESGSEETLEIEIEPSAEPGTGVEPSEEELHEIDFYLEQGLEDEARGLLQKLRARAPGSQELNSRLARLGGQAAPAAAEQPGNILEEIGREIEEEVAAPEAQALEQEAAEFFDLSSEIDESLFETQTAVEPELGDAAMGEEEHSLEEIFKAFKKGVEQQVDAADYETHYNLGIAYKEMGLIEEAIGEFQIAAKDSNRLLECCSMLGICFKEKGMTNLAVKWYQRGLESPGKDDEHCQGLKYDLAALYMEMGDYARAQELYTDVYGVNAKYREVSDKIRELEKLIAQEK